jgi:hypothetical protein
MRDFDRNERHLAHEIGTRLARDLDADTLAVMRRDADELGAGGSEAAAGWQLMAAALGEAWAYAQSAQDRDAGAAPVPLVGPPLPCSRPALHSVEGYSRVDGDPSPYGSLDWSVSACGAHASQYRDRIAAALGTAFVNAPRPTNKTDECGDLHDFAASHAAFLARKAARKATA